MTDTQPGHPIRRHVGVLVLAVIGLVVGIILVTTGRTSSPPSRGRIVPSTTVARPLLASLGSVASKADALVLIRALEIPTLAPPHPSSTTHAPPSAPRGVDLTAAGVQRCQGAIVQQTTDRSLGDRVAQRRLLVGDVETFVLSYVLPASGSNPAGHRIVLVDARTCRILGAVDR